MNLSEPKNLRRSMASFKRTKSSLSGYSDDETNFFTQKKARSTMDICLEDPKEEDCISD